MYSLYKIKLIFFYIKFMCSTASICTEVAIGIRFGKFITLYNLAQVAFAEFMQRFDESRIFKSMGITNIRYFTFGSGSLLSSVLITFFGITSTLSMMNALMMIGWCIHFMWGDAVILSFAFLELGSIGAMNTNIVYITEIVEPELRGFFSGLLVVGYSIGLIASLFLDLENFEKFYRFDSVTILCILICGLCLLISFALPEPPIRLLLSGKERLARNIFFWLHDKVPENEIKYQELVNLADKHVKKRQGNIYNYIFFLIFSKSFLKPLVLVLLICSAHAFIIYDPVIRYYRFKTVSSYTKKTEGIYRGYLTMMFAYGSRLFSSFLVSLIVHKVKRRPIFFISALSSAYALMILVSNEQFNFPTYATSLVYQSYTLFASFGLLTIPFFIMAEYFPQPLRQYGSGLALIYINYVSIHTIPRGQHPNEVGYDPQLRSSVYWFSVYAVFISTIVVFPIMPETEGLSLLQLENIVVEGPWIPRQNDTPTEEEDAGPPTPVDVEINENEEEDA